jgi:hypothetical protein
MIPEYSHRMSLLVIYGGLLHCESALALEGLGRRLSSPAPCVILSDPLVVLSNRERP